MCGPTGIGFLYGKMDLLSSMPPFLGKLLYTVLYYYFPIKHEQLIIMQ